MDAWFVLQLWKAEGDSFIAETVPRETKTIFIDAQIILMQSRVDNVSNWRDFALQVFGRRIQNAHRAFDHVIIAFDNYRSTPIFKSIEQSKRVKKATPFPFSDGQRLPEKIPDPTIWPNALQNRKFKTNLICVVAGLLLDHYKPPRQGTSLTVDFINTIRVDYALDGTITHSNLDKNEELGESDIKFMRYADEVDHFVVDSIDSDVVLIAMLYAESGGRSDVFVRRIATRAIDEVVVQNSGQKRTRNPPKQYELVHVRSLLEILKISARQAIGPEINIQDAHMTSLIIVTMLLTGSDYCRGLPRIGPRKLWDALHIVVPALLASSSFSTEGGFVLDESRAVEIFYVQIYYLEYSKYLSTDRLSYARIREELFASKLSEKTKDSLPTEDRLRVTIRNINWIIAYWNLRNKNPEAPLDGSCGFSKSSHGAGVAFSDEV